MSWVRLLSGTAHTMLLLIEVFDTVTGVLVLTESCLVFFGIKLGLIVPKLHHVDVHC